MTATPQPAVPEINYPALIEAAFAKNRKWTQGTTGCIAFARGAEWFRDQMLAATPAAPSQEPDVPQGFKPVGYLRSDEFDGHVFEPIDGTWPFDELLFSLSTSPEPVQEVTLTDEEIKRNWSGGACPPWGIKFARAIITALREKGKA